MLALSGVAQDDDIAKCESTFRERWNPAYVSVKVPLGDLAAIHRFESAGFSFVECQLQLLARFTATFDVSRHGYGYERVETASALESVLEVARESITHDRFSVDSGVPRDFSGRRYEAYVRKSWENPEEEVWRLFDPRRDLTVAFRTHRRVGTDEAILLLGGVRSDLKGAGIGVVSSHYCFNQMRQAGIKRAITHISAGNGPIVDLEIRHFGFRYRQAFAVLRKLYP